MPEERFRFRRDKIAWRIVGEAGVVLDLRTCAMYFLNETAAALWERLDGSVAPDQLADDLVARFGRSKRDMADDVSRWIAQLRQADLVEPVSGIETGCSPSGRRLPDLYAAPQLTREEIAFFAGVGCGKSAPTQMECAVALRDS